MIQNNWQELIKPSSIKVIKNNENNNNLILKAEPLERGYGTTLGNTLRRILLSSLQGAAIIGFKIDGVSHEYDSISEIKEDVMQIIANIKKIRFIKHTNEDKIIKISKSGPGLVTAKDIEVDSSVEVVNPETLICSLNDKASFNMEIDHS